MDQTPTFEKPMLICGCGNMGRAMLNGWLRSGIDPAAFIVVEPHPVNIADGVRVYSDTTSVVGKFSTALVAIKPQVFAEASASIASLLQPDAMVVSIMAGIRCATLQAGLPGRNIVRLMPNLAAALGKSPLGLFADGAPDREALERLLNPLGSIFWLSHEDQMDAVTALAGSGPAFAYRFIDALAKAGAELGLDPIQAQGLALSMVTGAAELAASSDDDPTELARKVTSPGGTTAAGLAVLDQNDALLQLLSATLRAARDRGRELSQS